MSARDPLRELEDALSFPVSPDFSARVRQQVAAEPVRARFEWAPWMSVAAAVVLTVSAGIMTMVRPGHEVAAPVNDPGLSTAVVTPTPPPREPIAEIEPVRAVHAPPRPVAGKSAGRYDTQVPDDQLRALDRLLASLREGRATVPPSVSEYEVNERGERVLRALVIEPVNIELLAGTPAEPNRNPVKDPNK